MFAPLLLLLAFQDVPTLSSEGVRDRTGEGVAFLETTVERRELWVEEPLVLTLRLGVAEDFIAAELIQLFRRPLGLPVQVDAAWLDDLPGTERLKSPPAEGRTSIALNGRIVEVGPAAVVEREGRRFRTFELRAAFLPQSAGAIAVPESRLRFAYATRFREDFVNGRVPEDRVDAYVRAEPLDLTVRELPLVGQTTDFRGAVGSFTVSALAEPRDLLVGERLQLELTIEGDGNLERLQPPPLDTLRGLHVLGVVDRFEAGRRIVTYDVETRSADVAAVPPIRFAFFDPREELYRTVETQPIPILVRRPEAVGVADELAEEQERGRGLLLLWLALPLVVLVYVVVRHARRKAPAAGALQLQHAARVFRERSAADGVDAADALVEFVAALLECSPAAVISRDLDARLRAAGLTADQSEETAALVERLHAPRYGGPPVADGLERVRALVDALSPA